MKKLFCWQCGKSLNYTPSGNPLFVVVTLPGGNQVKTHKVCRDSAIAYQTFDNTPPQGSLQPVKRGDFLREGS